MTIRAIVYTGRNPNHSWPLPIDKQGSPRSYDETLFPHSTRGARRQRNGFTAFGQADRAGSKDYPGITRMPGLYVDAYSDIQFDSATFLVDQNGKKTNQTIEGRTIKIHYYQKRDTPATSMLQIIRNLQNAARAAGGEVMDNSEGRNWYRRRTSRFTSRTRWKSIGW
jgi:hypothetical protein